jgi:hypothetical protein
MLYVGVKDEFVVERGKYSSTEVLDLNHDELLKIMPFDLTC